MTTKKNAVATTTENALAPVIDYGADFGAGLDDVGQAEVGIPFLKILQAQSPQVIGPEGKIPGAAAGMILNTGTELLSDSVTLVPALRQYVYVEWRDKGKGGGVIGTHQPGSDLVEAAIEVNAAAIKAGDPSRKNGTKKMKFGEFYTEEGNALVETFYVFAVVLEDDAPSGGIVLPFTSKSIPVYKKKFINRVSYCLIDDGKGGKRKPPMYSHRIVVSTEITSNDDGTWFNPTVTFANDNNVLASVMTPDHAGYQAGKELKAMIDVGDARADLSKASTTDGGDDAPDGGSAF